jgi:hypothetical protein
MTVLEIDALIENQVVSVVMEKANYCISQIIRLHVNRFVNEIPSATVV